LRHRFQIMYQLNVKFYQMGPWLLKIIS